jgi:hypothetical protein
MKTFKQFISEQEHPMIDVDGVMKHRNNSEGRPIHPTDEGIRNFHRWFGDSKAVDQHGRPQVHYHATDADFTKFKPSWRGIIYTAKTPKGADAGTVTGNAAHYPVYLKANKIRGEKGPGVFYGDAENKTYHAKIQKDGFDAIKVRDEAAKHGGTIAVFHPHQIKSAIGNNGNFSKDSEHIHESYEFE